MTRPTVFCFGLISLFLLASAVTAQPPLGRAGPGRPTDALQVHPDRRVTFRIRAPKASEVTVRGDWQTGGGPVKLEKDDKGVWSATVGPLAADFYSYTFIVDGVKTLDPWNPAIKQGITSL